MSELALHLIREAKHKRSTCLDLGNCSLEILPEELFELTWLEELYLGSEGFFYDFDKKQSMFFKSKNTLNPNCISHFGKFVSLIAPFKKPKPTWENFLNLKILLLRGNGERYDFRHIDALKYLISLQQLDISDTFVKDLKPLQYLNDLKFLNISNTKVKDLTPLKGLKNLERLYAENIPLSKFDWLTQKIEKIMTLEQLKETVHNHIGKAKTKDALDAIATWAHANNQAQLKSDINLLKGDFATLSRQQTLGLMDFSEATRETAKLNNRLMNLLNGIEEAKVEDIAKESAPKEEVKKKTSDKPLSVFISYSKRDIELKEELIIHLASLRRRNKATNWDDRHIIGGELWDETIKTKLKEADIILFLVSASFIATDYIWDYEIPIAEEQRQNGKARVIPIILKPCQWTKLDFAKHQALPSKGLPISSFSDRDTAWLEVVEGIEKVINDVLK